MIDQHCLPKVIRPRKSDVYRVRKWKECPIRGLNLFIIPKHLEQESFELRPGFGQGGEVVTDDKLDAPALGKSKVFWVE